MYRCLFPVLLLFWSVPAMAQDWTGVADRVMDASVRVYVEAPSIGARPEFSEDSPLARFNEMFDRRDRNVGSSGSGFLISSDGLVMTAYHVIDGARTVQIEHQGTKYPASLVAADATSDIALLSLSREQSWPFLEISEGRLELGQPLGSVGSAFDIGLAFKTGVVSAIDRVIEANTAVPAGYIQSSIPINQGDAGGPVVNLDGDVVGMNQIIMSRTGQSMGVSFHIPAGHMAFVVQQLVSQGRVRRGDLGITSQPVDSALMARLGYEGRNGLAVSAVFAGSAAERAGLREQDVILAMDGVAFADQQRFGHQVQRAGPGHTARLDIVRDSALIEVVVELGERAPDPLTLYLGTDDPVAIEDHRGAVITSGLALRAITERVARSHGLDPSTRGVIVMAGAEVYHGGGHTVPQPGDILIALDGEAVEDITRVERFARNARGAVIATFQRRDDTFDAVLVP
jgi:serine protease Do